MSLENPGDRMFSPVEQARTFARREHNKKLVDEGAKVVDGEFRVTPEQMDELRTEMDVDRADTIFQHTHPHYQRELRREYENSLDHQTIHEIKARLLKLRQLIGRKYKNLVGRLDGDLDEREVNIGMLCDVLGFARPTDKAEGEALFSQIEARIAECDSMDTIMLYRKDLRIGALVKVHPDEDTKQWTVRDIRLNGHVWVEKLRGANGGGEANGITFADLLRANPKQQDRQ